MMNVIEVKGMRAVQYDGGQDIDLLSSDEREILPADHTMVNYEDWIDDWSLSRQTAYVNVGETQVDVPDGWWIVRVGEEKFIIHNAAFQELIK